MPILHTAVRGWRKYPQILKLLVAHGVNLSAVSESNGGSVLHVAARIGSLVLIELLILARADAELIDQKGQTVLFPRSRSAREYTSSREITVR